MSSVNEKQFSGSIFRVLRSLFLSNFAQVPHMQPPISSLCDSNECSFNLRLRRSHRATVYNFALSQNKYKP
uniref:Uncharacterized protein n=1 Tax=Parascaris equorum TaxID=6256 RepID=A0A914RGJ2_PAREQ